MTKFKTTLQLPPADEYQRAILNPGVCFADSELRNGQPHINAWGLPLPWSGQFACVFRLKTKSGVRAVRCFTSQVTDQQVRYAALHTHLGESVLPMLADFDYQPQGVLVKGEWYPIVKMEWIDGETLDRVVEKHCAANNRQALASLAQQWAEVVHRLHSEQIAHGDLQHDNILVNNGRIHLVDYDGVYVPSLHHLAGLELGHPHYQHPGRKLADYGPGIDNFPALVIYLSLIALASDPTLWQRYHQDKHLILRNEDYRLRHESPLFLELTRSRSPEVVRLSLELLKACNGSVAAAPALTQLTTQMTHIGTSDWMRSWRGMEAAPVLLGEMAADRVSAHQVKAWSPRLRPRAVKLPPLTLPDPAPAQRWAEERLHDLVYWLTHIPASARLGGGLSLLILLLVGFGGGILASYLHAINASQTVSSLLYSAALPFVFVVTQRLRLALLSYIVLINVQALLLGEWNLAFLWYALIPGMAIAAVLQKVRRTDVHLRVVIHAAIIGLLAQIVVASVALDRSASWNEYILTLLGGVIAASAAATLARGVRSLILVMK